MSIEPALPKKTIEHNRWTEPEIDILMSMASVFTDQNKRIRWREIASATGHHESSCALKYHTVRSRAAGRLARDLIDADLAAKDQPVKPAKAPYGGKGAPVWSAEDDVRLLAACQGKIISGEAAWRKIAEGFPGRSFLAVRQRYMTLRKHADGILPDRDRMSRPIRPDRRQPVLNRSERLSAIDHTTITAAFFKDPPPGRSALDKKRAGIVDPPDPVDRRIVHRPMAQITLATEPMR